VVALVAGTIAVVATPGAAGAAVGPVVIPNGYVDAGTLHLELGAVDEFRWESLLATGQAGQVLRQSIGDNRCIVTLGGPDTLVALSAGNQQPGIANDAIGVFSGGSRGTPCSRVTWVSPTDHEQPLTLSLAGKLAPVKILRADLDIEVKSNAAIRADLLVGGVPTGTPFILRSGSSIVPGGSPDPGSLIFDCGARSDSGPDAGTADNCRFVLDGVVAGLPNGLFDGVRLTPLAGEFSLEGGADAPNWADSLFALATLTPTGTVTCPSSSGAPSTLVSQTGPDFSLTGSRGEDAQGTCDPLDYDLTFTGRKVTFLERISPDPDATFLFRVTFSTESAPSGNPRNIAPTKFSFDTDPSHTVFNLLACQGTLQFDSGGNFTGIADILTNPALDLLRGLDGVQYACAFDQVVDLVGSRQVQVTQGIYLIGDWNSFR
jgi:hypothetical protein